MKPTIEQLIESFNTWNPKTVEDVLKNCEVTLRYINSGAYRDVYEVVGHNLVVKVPIVDDKYDGVEHGKREKAAIDKIKKSRKKFVNLKKLLPEVYYHQNGVVLMRKYSPFPETSLSLKIADNLGDEIEDITGVKADGKDGDYHSGNFGRDSKGRIVLLDMGYFYGEH